jgi:hypothetical protein
VADGYSRTPRLTKGALIRLSEGIAGPLPQAIVFQYNPATLSRKLTPWQPPAEDAAAQQGGQTDPQAQPYNPEEVIDVAIEFDATDQLETADPRAVAVGVADRLAALEILLYPDTDSGGLMTDLVASLGGAASGAVPRSTVPVVLFAWGTGLVVPVRLTSYAVEEQAFSNRLYPVRAKVTVSMQVLTDLAFPDTGVNAQTGLSAEIARAAYRYTMAQRKALGAAGVGHAIEPLLNLLSL